MSSVSISQGTSWAMGKNGGPTGDLYLKVKFKKPLLQKTKDFIVSAFGR